MNVSHPTVISFLGAAYLYNRCKSQFSSKPILGSYWDPDLVRTSGVLLQQVHDVSLLTLSCSLACGHNCGFRLFVLGFLG